MSGKQCRPDQTSRSAAFDQVHIVWSGLCTTIRITVAQAKRKHVFGHMRTTKAKVYLRSLIRAFTVRWQNNWLLQNI